MERIFFISMLTVLIGCGPISLNQGAPPPALEDRAPGFIDSLPANTRIDSLPRVDIDSVTRADVKAIWNQACRRYGVEYVHYERIDRDAQAVAERLSDALGTPSARDLLSTRYVTLVFGDRKLIITAHKIGREGDPVHQLEVLAHELQHSTELSITRYALDKSYRARIEGRGEAAGADPRKLFGKSAAPNGAVFGKRWRRVYKLSTRYERKAAETYVNLTARHKRGLFATPVGADVARIISEKMR